MQAQIPHLNPYGDGPFTAFWLCLTYFKNRQNFLPSELDYPVHVITPQGDFNGCKTINVMHKRVLCRVIAFLGHIFLTAINKVIKKI